MLKKMKKGSAALLCVVMLLPVILYIVYFWRSGVFTSISDVSAVFQPGTYSSQRDLIDVHTRYETTDLGGVSITFDPDSSTWHFSGVCTETNALWFGHVFTGVDPGYLFLDYDFSPELQGSFYTLLPELSDDLGGTTSYYPAAGRNVYKYVLSNERAMFCVRLISGVDYTGVYFRVHSSFVVMDEDFYNFQVVEHVPGSFGEFLCNTFSIHELAAIISEPVIYGITQIGGSISFTSAYNVYVISSYCVYIMAIWCVLLVMKVVTFVPVAIMSFLDKIGGS